MGASEESLPDRDSEAGLPNCGGGASTPPPLSPRLGLSGESFITSGSSSDGRMLSADCAGWMTGCAGCQWELSGCWAGLLAGGVAGSGEKIDSLVAAAGGSDGEGFVKKLFTKILF